MDCREFEAELDRYLDERLDPRTPELGAHAERCSTCAELFQDALLLLRGVSAWKQSLPAHTGDLAGRITASITAPKTARVVSTGSHQPAKWQAWIVAAGSIAALWLMFVGSMNRQAPEQRIASIGYVNQQLLPSPTPKVPAVAPKADLETVLVSAEGAYSKLADKTFEAAQDFALLWPTSQAVTSNPAPSVTPETQGTDWNQALPQELAPISDSLGDALDFLRRAAPSIEKSAT